MTNDTLVNIFGQTFTTYTLTLYPDGLFAVILLKGNVKDLGLESFIGKETPIVVMLPNEDKPFGPLMVNVQDIRQVNPDQFEIHVSRTE